MKAAAPAGWISNSWIRRPEGSLPGVDGFLLLRALSVELRRLAFDIDPLLSISLVCGLGDFGNSLESCQKIESEQNTAWNHIKPIGSHWLGTIQNIHRDKTSYCFNRPSPTTFLWPSPIPTGAFLWPSAISTYTFHWPSAISTGTFHWPSAISTAAFHWSSTALLHRASSSHFHWTSSSLPQVFKHVWSPQHSKSCCSLNWNLIEIP